MTTETERAGDAMRAATAGQRLVEAGGPFLAWLADWFDALPDVTLAEAVPDPARAALISVDVVNGFCYEGPLSSPRIAGIVAPIAALMRAAHAAGVTRFVLVQEAHAPHAPEFAQFGPHCVRGTPQAETVAAFQALPLADSFVVLGKNSISPAEGTDLRAWLDAPAQAPVDTFLAVGDCTDLCLYQLGMFLKLRANAADRPARVIVPADCVQTYDLPVAAAAAIGALPHAGDLLHLIFLYHLALNGCTVVRHVGG